MVQEIDYPWKTEPFVVFNERIQCIHSKLIYAAYRESGNRAFLKKKIEMNIKEQKYAH